MLKDSLECDLCTSSVEGISTVKFYKNTKKKGLSNNFFTEGYFHWFFVHLQVLNGLKKNYFWDVEHKNT